MNALDRQAAYVKHGFIGISEKLRTLDNNQEIGGWSTGCSDGGLPVVWLRNRDCTFSFFSRHGFFWRGDIERVAEMTKLYRGQNA